MAAVDSNSVQPTPQYRRPDFFQVNLDLISPGKPLGVGLYVVTPEAGKVLLLEPDQALEKVQREHLLRKRIEVFALSQDQEAYRSLLQGRLSGLLKASKADEESLASLAYELSLYALDTALEKPDAETLGQAQEAISVTADLIMARDQVLFYLLELTRNDNYLHSHSCNVATFGLGLVKQLIKEGRKLDVRAAAAGLLFHDLGLIMISRDVLNKDDPLSEEETAQVRKHPGTGAQLLEESGVVTKQARSIVLLHHERLDGSGYPEGRRGDEIDIYGRIAAVADVFDALTTDRPYRKGVDPFTAATIMHRDLAGQFDTVLLKRFIAMFKQRR